MKVLIDISEGYYELIKNDVENHTTDYVPFLMIGNGIPLSGTNGEVIKAVFDVKILDVFMDTIMVTLNGSFNTFSLTWWNADYKEGSEE